MHAEPGNGNSRDAEEQSEKRGAARAFTDRNPADENGRKSKKRKHPLDPPDMGAITEDVNQKPRDTDHNKHRKKGRGNRGKHGQQGRRCLLFQLSTIIFVLHRGNSVLVSGRRYSIRAGGAGRPFRAGAC